LSVRLRAFIGKGRTARLVVLAAMVLLATPALAPAAPAALTKTERQHRTRCGTVFGHTGNFLGYTQFTASTPSGRRGLTFSVNRQLAPEAIGELAPQAFETLRLDYGRAVCTLLDGR
jgi:hypothetical protein